MADKIWPHRFKFNRSIRNSTISEIARFVVDALAEHESGDRHSFSFLQDLIITADLHFSVPIEDPHGETIQASLSAIIKDIKLPTANPRRIFWEWVLLVLCTRMAERLVVYRQETNPSKELTDSLRRFITGMNGFVRLNKNKNIDHEAVDKRWTEFMLQINSDRQRVLVSQLDFNSKLLRLSKSPLAQIESVADELKRQRQSRSRDSAAKIIELENREIKGLSRLRKRLESALDGASVHRSQTHLFAAKSYMQATAEIDAALGSLSSGEREQMLLLLQKRLELVALHEIALVLKGATECYRKIQGLIESSDALPVRCTSIIEQIIELLWLQRKSINVPHANVDVNVTVFKNFLRNWLHRQPVQTDEKDEKKDAPPPTSNDGVEDHTIADMWRPSLLKIEDRVRTGVLTVDTIQLVYDTILSQWYTLRVAHIGGAEPEAENQPDLFDLLGPTAPKIDFALKKSSTYAAVVQQRDVVRGLLREVVKASASVQRRATTVDMNLGQFTDLVMLPFLLPIATQWAECIDDYLKPMTPEHDDHNILAGAKNMYRDQAIARAAPQRLNHVAASLSTNTTFLLQLIKVFRLFMQIGAIYVAQKVFNESYVRKVFSEGRDPPPLTSMLFLMLSIDATAHLMIVILLVLSNFAFKRDDNTYLVDDAFLSEVLTEFAVSSLVLILLGMMIADILRRKRYFQFADQGQIVSIAFRSSLMYICIINFVVPYSMLIS